MSKLNDLINTLCPDGVEYKPLKNITIIETGKLNANASVPNRKYLFFTTAKEIFYVENYRWD